jgi:hypothetical protein
MTPQLRIESPGAVNYVNARGTEKKPGFTEIHFTHRRFKSFLIEVPADLIDSLADQYRCKEK